MKRYHSNIYEEQDQDVDDIYSQLNRNLGYKGSTSSSNTAKKVSSSSFNVIGNLIQFKDESSGVLPNITSSKDNYTPIWKQEVKDERGRKRFHGAFTGGFSAGYFNTVGSKEGWTPSTFTSSKSQKSNAAQMKPEDFMDDEDLSHQAKDLKTKSEYDLFQSGLPTTASTLPNSSSISNSILPTKQLSNIFQDEQDSVIKSNTKESIGLKLLKLMDHQKKQTSTGVLKTIKLENKKKRKEKSKSSSGSSINLDGMEIPSHLLAQIQEGQEIPSHILNLLENRAYEEEDDEYDNSKGFEYQDDDIDGGGDDSHQYLQSLLHQHQQQQQYLFTQKNDAYGVGYEPTNEIRMMKTAFSNDSSSSGASSGKIQFDPKRSSKGSSFGIGALEDDDDYDVYDSEPMQLYDHNKFTGKKNTYPTTTTTTKQQQQPNQSIIDFMKPKDYDTKFSGRCSDGTLPLRGFVISTLTKLEAKWFTPPKLPAQFNYYHKYPSALSKDIINRPSYMISITQRSYMLGEQQQPTTTTTATTTTHQPIPQPSSNVIIPPPPPPQQQPRQNIIKDSMQYLNDPGRRLRFNEYLLTRNNQTASITQSLDNQSSHRDNISAEEREKEIQVFKQYADTFTPLQSQLNDRFASASDKPLVVNSKFKKSKSIQKWVPELILCKRFDVDSPFTKQEIELYKKEKEQEKLKNLNNWKSKLNLQGLIVENIPNINNNNNDINNNNSSNSSNNSNNNIKDKSSNSNSDSDIKPTTVNNVNQEEKEIFVIKEAERPSMDLFKAIFENDDNVDKEKTKNDNDVNNNNNNDSDNTQDQDEDLDPFSSFVQNVEKNKSKQPKEDQVEDDPFSLFLQENNQNNNNNNNNNQNNNNNNHQNITSIVSTFSPSLPPLDKQVKSNQFVKENSNETQDQDMWEEKPISTTTTTTKDKKDKTREKERERDRKDRDREKEKKRE
ncbi:hypothetical protein CYY_008481, partial [Polysphondylium violaceum]